LIDAKGFAEDKVRLIHPGAHLNKFSPEHVASPGLKHSVGISDGDPVIVFVGRLEPQKGHRVLLDAMPVVRSAFPQVHLICAGEGSLRGDLERQVSAIGLLETVKFIGYPNDVRDWLAIADLTVLPSFYEGLPVTLIESLAAGKAVVATAVDGTPEVIINGETGLTVPPGDQDALAAAICLLLSDDVLRRRLAANGRAHVLDAFSVQRMVESTQQLYLELWEQRVRGSGKRHATELPQITLNRR
jgi:glycosyltransferase involved in cell wall biosynthesis